MVATIAEPSIILRGTQNGGSSFDRDDFFLACY